MITLQWHVLITQLLQYADIVAYMCCSLFWQLPQASCRHLTGIWTWAAVRSKAGQAGLTCQTTYMPSRTTYCTTPVVERPSRIAGNAFSLSAQHPSDFRLMAASPPLSAHRQVQSFSPIVADNDNVTRCHGHVRQMQQGAWAGSALVIGVGSEGG